VKTQDGMVTLIKNITDFIEESGYMDENIILYDGFESAFIGISVQNNMSMATYDYDKCLNILIDRDNMSVEEADEYMQFNVIGAHLGDSTPIFIMCKIND
jgi:hypothetical protein